MPRSGGTTPRDGPASAKRRKYKAGGGGVARFASTGRAASGLSDDKLEFSAPGPQPAGTSPPHRSSPAAANRDRSPAIPASRRPPRSKVPRIVHHPSEAASRRVPALRSSQPTFARPTPSTRRQPATVVADLRRRSASCALARRPPRAEGQVPRPPGICTPVFNRRTKAAIRPVVPGYRRRGRGQNPGPRPVPEVFCGQPVAAGPLGPERSPVLLPYRPTASGHMQAQVTAPWNLRGPPCRMKSARRRR